MTFFWEAIDFWFLYGNRMWQSLICPWSWKNEIHWFCENCLCYSHPVNSVKYTLGCGPTRGKGLKTRRGLAQIHGTHKNTKEHLKRTKNIIKYNKIIEKTHWLGTLLHLTDWTILFMNTFLTYFYFFYFLLFIVIFISYPSFMIIFNCLYV